MPANRPTHNSPDNSVRQHIANMLVTAPPAVVSATLELMQSLKTSLSVLRHHFRVQAPHTPVRDWGELLLALTSTRAQVDKIKIRKLGAFRRALPDFSSLLQRFDALKTAHEESLLMIELAFELINAGDEFLTADELLEESAAILSVELSADMFVCRLKNSRGDWVNVASDSLTQNSIPLFARGLETDLPYHPVMRALKEDPTSFFVVSENLVSSEKGGDSFDCIPYQEGLRSRLAFILRDENSEAFGLIMLYSRGQTHFGSYQSAFLADCARIVSLTVGRRLQAASDALAKAAGGMAHVGNNALAVLTNYVELMLDEFAMLSKHRFEAIEAADEALTSASPDQVPPAYFEAVEKLLSVIDNLNLERRVKQLDNIRQAAARLTSAIRNLEAAVKNPKLAAFTSGQEFLDLDPCNQESTQAEPYCSMPRSDPADG